MGRCSYLKTLNKGLNCAAILRLQSSWLDWLEGTLEFGETCQWFKSLHRFFNRNFVIINSCNSKSLRGAFCNELLYLSINSFWDDIRDPDYIQSCFCLLLSIKWLELCAKKYTVLLMHIIEFFFSAGAYGVQFFEWLNLYEHLFWVLLQWFSLNNI